MEEILLYFLTLWRIKTVAADDEQILNIANAINKYVFYDPMTQEELEKDSR